MNAKDETQRHFFAASICTWATTTPSRSLRDLLKLMDEDGYAYNLYMVPTAWDTDYDIKMFQPQVGGAVWLDFFNPAKQTKQTKKGKS